MLEMHFNASIFYCWVEWHYFLRMFEKSLVDTGSFVNYSLIFSFFLFLITYFSYYGIMKLNFKKLENKCSFSRYSNTKTSSKYEFLPLLFFPKFINSFPYFLPGNILFI